LAVPRRRWARARDGSRYAAGSISRKFRCWKFQFLRWKARCEEFDEVVVVRWWFLRWNFGWSFVGRFGRNFGGFFGRLFGVFFKWILKWNFERNDQPFVQQLDQPLQRWLTQSIW
jgi:hypothetical protein